MNKPLLGSLVLLLVAMNWLQAQNLSFHWMRKSDGETSDLFSNFQRAQLVIDSKGNIYQMDQYSVEMNFGDTLLFDEEDATPYFLVKYNQKGQLQWARKIVGLNEGTPAELYWGEINSLNLDAEGNVVICGSLESSHLDLGAGDIQAKSCPDRNCTSTFVVTYSPQGDLLEVEQFQTISPESEDFEYYGTFSPVMNINKRGDRFLSLVLGADTLKWGDQALAYQDERLIFAHENAANHKKRITSIQIDPVGTFYPLELVAQKDGSALLFGETESEAVLSDSSGFVYQATRHTSRSEYSYFLLKYNPAGRPQWAKELYGEYLAAQLTADSLGNAYVTGYFDYFLEWDGRILQEEGSELMGFILKIDAAGEVIWYKIYPNAGIDVSLTANAPTIDAAGGLLAPLTITTPGRGIPTTLEGHEVIPHWEEYASALGHYKASGVLDTFVEFKPEEGLFFVTNLRYDAQGRIYGLFQTAGTETIKIGNYSIPVIEQTTEILACFTLSNLPPSFTAPKAVTKVEKTTENLRIIRTYPNPTDNQLTVEWVAQPLATELSLRDAYGKVLYTIQVGPQVSQFTLDLARWPAGWYVLEWSNGNRRESQGVLKK